MKTIRLLSVLVFGLALFSACGGGGGGGDPLSSEDSGAGDFGGQLTQGSAGANRLVTDADKFALSQYMINQVYQAYKLSLNSLASLPAGSDSLKSVRVTGNYYGYAVAAFNTSASGSGSTLDLNESITFYNYSDSGKVFTGGSVDCIGSAAKNNGAWVPNSLKLSRGLVFAGEYAGSIVFSSQDIPLDSQGRPYSVYATAEQMNYRNTSGNLTIHSGDNNIIFNPYYRLDPPKDTMGLLLQ